MHKNTNFYKTKFVSFQNNDFSKKKKRLLAHRGIG